MNGDRPAETKGSDILPDGLGWQTFGITSIALLVLVLATIIWFAIDVLLLLFAAILLANLFIAATDWLAARGLPRGAALALVVVGTLLLITGLAAALVPSLGAQVPELTESLRSAVERLQQQTGFAAWAEQVASDLNLQSLLPSPSGLVGGATGVISSTFGMLANLVIMVVVALYLAVNPQLYLEGAVRLVPIAKRARVRETLIAIGHTLRWWFAGQLGSMTAVGLLSFAGLSLLGIPLALVLSVIAFVLTFIPYIGAVLSGIPVVLVAFAEGPQMALYALLLFVFIQSLEGYVITPMIQKRSVYLPPAITVVAQILAGVLLGALGIMLATPLTAATMVAVRKLYIGDVLGEPERRA